jgi:hypothetical protein
MMGDYQVRFPRQLSGQAVREWRGSSSGLPDPPTVSLCKNYKNNKIINFIVHIFNNIQKRKAVKAEFLHRLSLGVMPESTVNMQDSR